MPRDLLSPHPGAPLEYWFFKVNAGPVALLVDWIERRPAAELLLRVSIHAPGRRQVLFEALTSPLARQANYLSMERTVGQLGDISWDLHIDPGGARIAPDLFPLGLLRVADLSLVSAPLGTFTGTISIRGRDYSLEGARGLVSHYWGRRLASSWWWVSANQFDDPDVAVECSLLRTRLWGTPAEAQLAYLYLRRKTNGRLYLALPGMCRVSGSPEHFEINFQRFGQPPIILTGTGRDYGDLRNGIINTLVGDLEVREGDQLIAVATGTAGLERRAAA